jgi:glycosyltransferase involved in cell wall biosynthesis
MPAELQNVIGIVIVMRIAMVSTPFLAVPPAKYGGTELVIHELVEGLVAKGHHVVLFATGDSKTSAELRFAFPEAQWPPGSAAEMYHVSSAMDQIAHGDFDLVHTHSALTLGFGRLLPDLPIVYTLHHHRVEELSQFYRHFPKTNFVAISKRQRELEIPLPNCEVIYHGLDPDRFECSSTASDYVSFVGRFSEEKGPHFAIDVARKAGLPIYMAGEVHPPDKEFAKQEMESRLREPHVHPLGPIGVTEKVPLLKNSRALLAPITWEEPFGLILAEAMLCGCPVIAFPRGSTPELIENGITGYLVNTPDEMADVIRPGGVLDSFDRHRCRTHAANRFSRERMVADHIRLYNQIVDERSSAEVLVA